MKSLLLAAGLGLSLAACTTSGWSEAPLDDSAYHQGQPPVDWWGRNAASVNVFFPLLADHGTWGRHDRYGRVFYPSVGAGWQPYRAGYWRQDPRFGRMWMSDEPWGWATYHYGRWGRDERMRWFWVPETRFGPGWVDWRSGGDYVSWSPLPPSGWSRWGTGWGNDWWSHAPAYWAWRPGMQQHVRPGRPGYPGRHERPDRTDRPDRPDRPGEGRALTPVPPNVHPRSSPPYTGGERNPRSDQNYVGGERQPRAGWRGGEHDGRPAAEAGRHPRSTFQRPQTRPAPSSPQARPAPSPQARPAPSPRVRDAPLAPATQRAPSREPARGRDVPSRAADD